jgi:hypothetical protein
MTRTKRHGIDKVKPNVGSEGFIALTNASHATTATGTEPQPAKKQLNGPQCPLGLFRAHWRKKQAAIYEYRLSFSFLNPSIISKWPSSSPGVQS